MERNLRFTLLEKGLFSFNEVKFGQENSDQEVAAIVKSVASYGFKFDPETVQVLKKVSNIKDVYFDIIELLKEYKHGNVDHVVFYRNFPDVPSIDEQFIYAVIHYMTGLLPEDLGQPKKERFPLYEDVALEEIKYIPYDKAWNVLKEYVEDMLEMKASWSESQKEVIKEVMLNTNVKITTPNNKENMCWLVANTPVSPKNVLKTSTDVLRYAVALNNGDITLATNTKFKLSRSKRKEILSILDSLKYTSAMEDMQKYKEVWIRLGEVLHPGEYSKQYPDTAKMFKNLREKVKVETFNSKVEKLLAEKKFLELSEELKKRPGEFARRLDCLVRQSSVGQLSKILSNFESCADKVAVPVLMQLYKHFKYRTEVDPTRVFVLKGLRTKVKEVENDLEPLPEFVITNVLTTLERTLVKIFMERDFLEENSKVHIEPRMFDIQFPDNSQRGASAGRKALTKGSKLSLEGSGESLRFFTHWKNQPKGNGYDSGRVDIDIAALMYDKDGKFISELSWRNARWGLPKSLENNTAFSGDITSAPNGASEFIDVNVNGLKDSGVKYIVIVNNVYTSQTFAEIPECFCGVMLRKDLNSGEVFEPSTVKSSAELSAASANQNISFVYDIDDESLVWIDSSLDYMSRVAGSNNDIIFAAVKNIIKRKGLSVGDIYSLYAKAHNIELVNNPEEATFVVGNDVTEFDVEKFSKLL